MAPGRAESLTRPRGDGAWAITVPEESLALFRPLEDAWGVGLALTGGGGLGDWAWARRDYARATAVYREGLELHRSMPDMSNVAFYLEALARVALGQERPELAARLFGAAEAVYEASGTCRAPSRQPYYERDRAAVRARLGEEAFSGAWAAGRAMSREQAVTHPLAEPWPGRAPRPEEVDGRKGHHGCVAAGYPAQPTNSRRHRTGIMRAAWLHGSGSAEWSGAYGGGMRGNWVTRARIPVPPFRLWRRSRSAGRSSRSCRRDHSTPGESDRRGLSPMPALTCG